MGCNCIEVAKLSQLFVRYLNLAHWTLISQSNIFSAPPSAAEFDYLENLTRRVPSVNHHRGAGAVDSSELDSDDDPQVNSHKPLVCNGLCFIGVVQMCRKVMKVFNSAIDLYCRRLVPPRVV